MKVVSKNIAALKHELLLVSLLIFLFGPVFVPSGYHEIVKPFLQMQTLAAGIIFFNERKGWQFIFIGLFCLILGATLLNLKYDSVLADSISKGIFIFFFLSITSEVFRQIYITKEIGRTMIAAVFSGFILLCLMAAFFFSIIENQSPESFSNLGTGANKFQDLTYFSFITTLTIGYGDIVPLTIHAKKATMLIALLGNFYSVFVVGIVIGKFINNRS